MTTPTMRVRLAPGTRAMVPNYEAADGGLVRFLGRRFDPAIKPHGGWVPTGEVLEVPHRLEYLHELQAKPPALVPADEETAKLAGVPMPSASPPPPPLPVASTSPAPATAQEGA